MKNTWYLGLLIIALAYLGISLDKTDSANQEIVLKFTDVEVTEGETKDVLHFVKSQIENIAVGPIQIKESDNGTLKITYYSDIAISQIKQLLTKGNDLLVEDKSNTQDQFPVSGSKDLTGFQLDVFEIQTAKDVAGASGTVVEFKTESVRFFTPDVYTFSEELVKKKNESVELAFHTYTTIALTIDDSFCVVPQVRAGPAMV